MTDKRFGPWSPERRKAHSERMTKHASARKTGAAEAKPRLHDPDCNFLRAMRGTMLVECEHGYDVCPRCDPCSCKCIHGQGRWTCSECDYLREHL